MSSFDNGLNGTNQNPILNNQTEETSSEKIGDHYRMGGDFSVEDPFGLGTINLMGGRVAGTSMSGALTSERYSKLLKKMQELASDKNNNQNILRHVLSLDKSVFPQVHFACIVICVQSKLNIDAGLGYQVLIVDGTNVPLPMLEETNNSVTEVLTRFSEEVWNDELRLMVMQRIINLVSGTNKDNIYFSAPVLIGEETDPENEQQVFQILSNAVLAAQSAVALRAGNGKYYSDLNLGLMVENKTLPELYITHTANQTVIAPDEVGNIARVSFVSKLQTGKPNKGKGFIPNSGKAAQSLLEIGTYTDLLPVMPSGQQNGFFQQNQMMGQQMQPLVPLVVITTVRSSFALTPGATELGIVLAADQVRSNRWVEDFRHKGNTLGSGIDFADVGAILVNMPNPQAPGELMPEMYASDPRFSDEVLWEILGRYVRNTAIVAMDVPAAGGSSWYEGLYASAAHGSPKALELIHKSINTLTHGAYNKLIDQLPSKVAPPVFTDNIYYLERGHWRLGDRILPLELLDNYVAVCCYARQNKQPNLVAEYVDTITNRNRSQISRLNHRRKILLDMSGGTAKFTRSVKRVLFNPAHRALVNQAINAAKVVMHSDESIQFNLTANTGFASGLANVQAMNVMLNVAGSNQSASAFGGGTNYGF